jgi:hypothetical protein
MDKQPACGVHGPPSEFARHAFEECKRLALSVTEEQESQAFGETLLQPLDLRFKAFVLRIPDAADTAIR